MNTYLLLRHLHISCVVLSGAGFLLRLYWMASASPRLRSTRSKPCQSNFTTRLSAACATWKR